MNQDRQPDSHREPEEAYRQGARESEELDGEWCTVDLELDEADSQ